MIPLLNGYTPPQQDIINLITEKKPAIVEQVKEPTLEEKIASNYYKCDESIFWIRADNAQCLPKQQTAQVTTQVQKPVSGAVNASGNGYEAKSCTWWVKQWKPEVGNNWGDAQNWGYAAQAEGWTVSSTPVVGAIAWTTKGEYGHVGLVVSVEGNSVVIQEGNYDWNGSVRTTTVAIGLYKYIH